MAADLYETYTVTLVAAMLLAKSVFGAESAWVEFPLLMGGVSIIASIIGTFFVKLGANNYIMGALYKGLAVSGVLAAIAFYGVTTWFMGLPGLDAKGFTPMSVFGTAIIGLALTGLIVWITEYYTAKEYRPVQTIAKASLTGHGTNVIAGLAMSMEATALPAFTIVGAILGAYYLGGGFSGNAEGGLFAIALSAVSMLSMTGIALAGGCHMFNVVMGYANDPQFERKEAVRLFRLALSVDDSDPDTLAAAAMTSASMVGDSESEIEMADRAVALNPNSYLAWAYRGWVYGVAGQPEEAIRSFERAIRMSPADPLLHRSFAGMGYAFI